MKSKAIPFPGSKDDPVPAKWRWHQRVLLALRRRLVEEARARRADAAEPIEPHSLHAGDSATDEFDHDVAFALLGAEESALEEVDAALERLRRRRYGICEATGARIPAARLRAVPWCRYSLPAERALEQRRATAARVPGLVSLRGRGRDIPEAGTTTRADSEGPPPEPAERAGAAAEEAADAGEEAGEPES